VVWPLVELTPREHEVAVLAAHGLTSGEIADRLVVSVRTVDNTLPRAYRKLGIARRAQLAGILITPE
jgi:DNA-binding CsgD family transcriptional regulator